MLSQPTRSWLDLLLQEAAGKIARDGAQAQLFVQFGTATSTLLISESLDEMDGIEPAAA